MGIVTILGRIGWWLVWPFVMAYRGIWWAIRKVGEGFAATGRGILWVIRRIAAGIMAVIRGIIATPMAIVRAPVRLY